MLAPGGLQVWKKHEDEGYGHADYKDHDNDKHSRSTARGTAGQHI